MSNFKHKCIFVAKQQIFVVKQQIFVAEPRLN